jgi:hypothetical protein
MIFLLFGRKKNNPYYGFALIASVSKLAQPNVRFGSLADIA